MFSIVRLYISRGVFIKKNLKWLIYFFKLFCFHCLFQRKFSKNPRSLIKVYEGFTGYYDKLVIDPRGNNVLFHIPNKSICKIYIVNLKTDKKTLVGTTSSWNFQQGAMAEWIDTERIIYNNFRNGSLSAFIFNLSTKSTSEIKYYPVQTLLNGKESYISLNYNNLTALRPDYGFKKISKAHNSLSKKDDGLWKVNFSGHAHLFVSLEELHCIENLEQSVKSKVNHVSSSKCGNRILFLFRYFRRNIKTSSLFLYDFSSQKLQKLMSGVISHYCWLNSNEYVVWYRTHSGGKLEIYDYRDSKNYISSIQTSDGHPTTTEDGSIWFDSYPNLFNHQKIRKFSKDLMTLEEKIMVLNRPSKNIQERCDAHPKCIGTYLVIDCHQSEKREFKIYQHKEV